MRRLLALALTVVVAVTVVAALRDGKSPRAVVDDRLGAAVTRAREEAESVGDAVRDRTSLTVLPKLRCPAGTKDCVTARGRVFYVEANDPDGDGDLHVILAGGSVTAPGISIIKVTKGRRPKRVPRVGDAVSAAGTVVTGSRDESELKALAFRVRPR